MLETTNGSGRAAGLLRSIAGILVLGLMAGLAGCASRSLGELPLLQETLHGHCGPNAVKECVVSGGNRFDKRYEYCGCRGVRDLNSN